MPCRDWIVDSAETSFNTGKVLEHTWAMIFGEAAVTLPLPECELTHCNGNKLRVHMQIA